MTIVETWPMAFDPIQIVLGLGGIAMVVLGLAMRMSDTRQRLGRRARLLGLGLLAATVLYSLVLTWTSDIQRR